VTTNGNGLSGIRERVRSLAGTLEIESPRGKGTTLRVRLPLTGSATSALTSSNTAAAMVPVGETARQAPAPTGVVTGVASGGEKTIELGAVPGAVRT